MSSNVGAFNLPNESRVTVAVWRKAGARSRTRLVPDVLRLHSKIV